ncbi:FadR/GntR family transcriptional regulator [Brachybacterium kimchii]|uniref:FCD domain-containing protein n=1 Tax=Brachybacterium kimchii TaxID=2942909 RepID=A0ABY4N574_9MICO|nr:FCD domain-containing protein [Brachybacterium kimchii]UQN28535.1 FCD domain-containing protein [Brachybacterium kimchii]
MRPPGESRFDSALDTLGCAIVLGELPAEHADTIEGLVARTGASRSVVREATRVLSTLGMLTAGRRVGLRVLPFDHWDTMDPLVIRWRLRSPGRIKQIAELRELRRAIEPEAAALAARRVSRGEVSNRACGALAHAGRELRTVASGIGDATEPAHAAAYLHADSLLHSQVLALSANAMFIRLQAVIDESLRERALHERMDLAPEPHDVDLHGKVVRRILAGEPHAATAAMREIVERTGDLDS